MGILIQAGQILDTSTSEGLNQYYGYADTGQTSVVGTGPANLSTVYTIPANEPQAGSAYEMICGGSGTWGSTAQSLTLSLYLQGTVICANVTISNAVFNVNAGFRWRLTADWVCSATGSSGKFFGGYSAVLTQTANQVVPGTAADNTVPVADGNAIGVTIDTTASTMFAVVKAGFASNTGSPTISNFRTMFRKVA
jgi:hypothetical protein